MFLLRDSLFDVAFVRERRKFRRALVRVRLVWVRVFCTSERATYGARPSARASELSDGAEVCTPRLRARRDASGPAGRLDDVKHPVVCAAGAAAESSARSARAECFKPGQESPVPERRDAPDPSRCARRGTVVFCCRPFAVRLADAAVRSV